MLSMRARILSRQIVSRKLGALAAPAAVLLSAFVAWPASAQHLLVQAPPAELSFLSTTLKVRTNIPYEVWGEWKFSPDWGLGAAKQGKHWTLIAETGTGTDRLVEWNKLKPVFLQNGWTVAHDRLPAALHYNKNGVDAWVYMDDTGGAPVMFKLEVIEVVPPPVTLTLAAPAAMPETVVPEKGDFPYLGPLPGAKFHGGLADNSPYFVMPTGAQQAEIVANGSILKTYDFPGLSEALLVAVYADGLAKAGWTILDKGANLHAHYAKNGRNIWTTLDVDGDGYRIRVADAGVPDLAANLAKACHVALYGVLFDFNKSTLQPTSDAALLPVVDIMTKDKALKVEVQGHTDNVGNDAYNQTLSEARAKTVAAWLGQHGIAADRLSAKGYGKTKPVADNGNDQGRAKNRRVEIADPRCSPKS